VTRAGYSGVIGGPVRRFGENYGQDFRLVRFG